MKKEYKLKMLESELRKVLAEALMEMKDPYIDTVRSTHHIFKGGSFKGQKIRRHLC